MSVLFAVGGAISALVSFTLPPPLSFLPGVPAVLLFGLGCWLIGGLTGVEMMGREAMDLIKRAKNLP